MPELPEVESVRLGLLKYEEKTVTKLEVNDPKVWFESEYSAAKINSQKLERVSRRGKYLIFGFSGGFSLIAHLRMTGKFLDLKSSVIPAEVRSQLATKGAKGLQIRAIFHFEKEQLVFFDTRRFGTISAVKSESDFFQHKKIAPDLIEQSAQAKEWFVQRHPKLGKPLKAALLDQSLLAGVGNIYADEICHRLGLHPLLKTKKLNPAVIFETAHAILMESIRLGGTTVYNYTNADGQKGMFVDRLKVYGRENCGDCGSQIQQIQVAGRTTHFCEQCQKKSYRGEKGRPKAEE